MSNRKVCFFGHSDAPWSVKPKLREVILDLIDNEGADARILTGGDTPRHLGHLGICVHVDEVHSRLSAKTAACGGLRYGTFSGVVDPFSLSSVTCEFGNSRSDFSAERKYLSGTSGI